MAPKKVLLPQHENTEMTEEEVEQLAQLMQMLALEDAQQSIASSSNETLGGYLPTIEKKLQEYINAYKTVKKEVDSREAQRSKEQRKINAETTRQNKKETEALRRAQPITINIRFFNHEVFTLTVPMTTTLGEMRRLILAHWNSTHPTARIAVGKKSAMGVYLGDCALHLNPRKTLGHLDVTNDSVLTVVNLSTSSSATSSSQPAVNEAESVVNDEEESEEEDMEEPDDVEP